ncbi:hypothetical protein [Paraburkholderia sp. D1E]|uniref:hypothetical protein n=1 Tax=Paraburkholderia sp. D1E TaxID=3461398 RepID=UPI004045575E
MKGCLTKVCVGLAISCALPAYADCVIGAKGATKYQVLDNHTILLSGGISGSILIKSFTFFTSSSQVAVLKDDFCDFEDAVLYVDGETVDAQQVKQIR